MKKFDSTQHSEAALQLKFSKLIKHPIEDVWKVISHHQGMTQWMPLIKRVNLVKPDPEGGWGEGCERHCQFGPDLLKERIVHWNPPYGYAYSISDMHLVRDHVGHIGLTEKLEGTLVTWTQYYVPNSHLLKN